MPKVLIVVPCYNEGNRIELDLFDKFLLANKWVDLLFVNDGSTDNTYELLDAFCEQKINAQVMSLSCNCGKAEALRKVILQKKDIGKYKYLGYFDADLSTPLEYVCRFVKILQRQENPFFLVTGARVKRLGAKIYRKGLRHVGGRVVATLASRILKLPIYDTQCGAKIFDVSLVLDLFKESFVSKWLFDIELFARLIQLKGVTAVLSGVLEYPLEQWIDEGGSKVKVKDYIRTPIELYKIYRHYRFTN